MIFIKPEYPVGRSKVSIVHYQPDLLSEEEKGEGILLESLPNPQTPPDKMPVLYYDNETNTLSYDYIDRPLTPEDELKQIKEKQALMQQAIDELIFGGAL